MPLSGATILAAALAPRMLAESGPRLTLGAGLGLPTIGSTWLATAASGESYLGGLLPPTLLFGLGLGFTFVPATYLAIHELETRQRGMGSALLDTSQQLGGAVGLALVMTLVDSRIGDAAPVQLAGETSASGYRLGFAATAGLPNAATAMGRGAITTTSHPPAPRRCSALSLFAPRD